MMFGRKPATMIDREDALPGRDEPIDAPSQHVVLETPMTGPWPDGFEVAVFAMGCFWGSERLYWRHEGVWSTSVGYAAGFTPNPTYRETTTGRTGSTEAVLVVFDPTVTSYEALLKIFWENHDPTTPNRQGNDVGTQYRSGIYPTSPEQLAQAIDSASRYQQALTAGGYGEISTEIVMLDEAGDGQYYLAEEDHQQYLAKNPGGYCNHGFCQVGYDVAEHGQVAVAQLPDV